MPEKQTIPLLVMELRDQIVILGIAGIGGALLRAVLAPEAHWKRRLVQGGAGIVSAMFLGGAVADLIATLGIVKLQSNAWLASGFIMGYGGEIAVKKLQDRLIGGK